MHTALCLFSQAVLLSKKELRDRRRQQRGDYQLTSEAKTSWEKLRRHRLPNTERKQLMEKLLTAITGQIHQVTSNPKNILHTVLNLIQHMEKK